jgi:multiple sugar transport system substrate-binding protein
MLGTSAPNWSRRRLIASAATLATGGLVAPRRRRAAAASRHQTTSLSFALSAADRVRVLPLLEAYERETGVMVHPVVFGDLYRALSISLMGSECEFDVVSIDDCWVPVFAGGRFLSSLDDLGEATKRPLDVSDFLPSFLSLGFAPDSTELFAVPWVGNIQLFGFDEDVFHAEGLAAPQSWPETIAAAESITRARAPETFGFGLRGRPGGSATASLLPILRGFGAELFDAEWRPQLKTDRAFRAMATLIDLAAQSPTTVIDTGAEELAAQLQRGEIAQSVDLWPSQLFSSSLSEEGNAPQTIKLGPIPREPDVEPVPMTGSCLLGIPAACDTTGPAALEFIRWLTSPVQQRHLLLHSGVPPTRHSIMNDPAMIDAQPLLPQVAEYAAIATPRPRTHYYPAVEQILGFWVSAAIAGEVTGGQALNQANTEIEAVVRPGQPAPTTGGF